MDRAGPLRPPGRLRPEGRVLGDGVPAGVRSGGRVDPRRQHARPAGAHDPCSTRLAADGSLAHRIQMEGRNDEFRETRRRLRHDARTARDTRCRTAAVRGQRLPRAAYPAGDHADAARRGPQRSESSGTGELVDRLSYVNTRAIELTEALLLLSRANQRSFAREHVDLSLVAEEAAETRSSHSPSSTASPSRPPGTSRQRSAHGRSCCR